MKSLIPPASIAVLMLCTTWGVAADERARLAVAGDVDFLNIGQNGYCGARTTINSPTSKAISFAADRRTWFRVKSTMRVPVATYTCAGEFSFLPKSGSTYLARFSFNGDQCTLEFFRAVPGTDPVREHLIEEDPQVCFVQ